MKIMLKKIIILLSLLLIFSSLEAKVYPRHQAGLGYSFLSGAGINYLYELDPDNVLKLAFFMYYEGEQSEKRDIYANLGIEYHYNILKNKQNRLYALIGGSWWNLHDKSYSEYFKNDITYIIKSSDFNRIFNFGTGIGYEFRTKKFSFSADGGLMIQNSLNGKFHGVFNQSEGNSLILPFAGISIRYIIK